MLGNWSHPSAVSAAVARRAHRICLPTFGGQRGHPVLFGSEHFPALQALDGDTGARTRLASSDVVEVAMDDDAVLRDIDRGEDWPSGERPARLP